MYQGIQLRAMMRGVVKAHAFFVYMIRNWPTRPP